MSTDTAIIAGVQFIEQRPTHDTNIEYWMARCGERLSEVFLLPLQHRERLNSLPNLIGFTQCRVVEVEDQLAVIMPGVIQIPTTQMIGKIGVTGCVGMAWHISDMLSLLHQSGRAHNLLHPESIGLNDLGELEIRPALGRFISSDPDPKATAIATDCWQMRQVIQHLGISDKIDPLFTLLNRGLQEESARLRLQPATAIRQSISAVLARHSEWEETFVEQMGSDWSLNQRNLQESTIIPHRLKSTRPTLSIDDVKDMADSLDLWGNLFTSSSIDEVSSSQALLLEALSGKQASKEDLPISKIQLPTHRGEPIEEDSSTLEIDLIGPTSIQVPVQAKRPGLVSIQEVGINEVPTIEEQDFYHGFSAIVEETADNLEILHRRRRRSQSRREPNSYGQMDAQPSFFEERTEVISPPVVEEVAFEQTVVEIAEQSISESLVEDSISVDTEPSSIIQSESISVEESVSSAVDVTTFEEDSVEVYEQETMHADSEVSGLETSVLPPIVEVGLVEDEEVLDTNDEGSSVKLSEEVYAGIEEESREAQFPENSPSLELSPSPVVAEIEDVDQEMLVDNIPDLVAVASQIAEPLVEESTLDSETAEVKVIPLVEEIDVVSDTSVEASELSVEELKEVEPSVQVENAESDLDVSRDAENELVKGDVDVFDEESVNDLDIDHPSIGDVTTTPEFISDTPPEPDAQTNIVIDNDSEQVDVNVPEYVDDIMPTVQEIDLSSEEIQEAAEEVSEESETTSPVSIHNMPLISIVEEDDFNSKESSEESEESEDEAGVSIQFLMDTSEPPISSGQLDQVFEADSSGPSVDVESGFVATLNPENSAMSTGVLDVEEPLADIEFPSIEEVRAQDQTFAGDVNALFDSSESVVAQSSHPNPSQLIQVSASEPKWTGATSFDNLTNAEDALGDEKYAYAQVELGDVDAVLGESIRDYSELERRGSPWGLLLLISLVVICAIVYVLSLDTSSSTEVETVENRDVPATSVLTQVEIQTDPPRGTVLIDSNSLGVAPVKWDISDGDLFLMCVDWGSNPVCRRVPRSDLQTETYTFTQRLTP